MNPPPAHPTETREVNRAGINPAVCRELFPEGSSSSNVPNAPRIQRTIKIDHAGDMPFDLMKAFKTWSLDQ